MASLLGQLLQHKQLVDAPTLEKGLDKARHAGTPLGDTLVALGALEEEAVYRCLAEQLALPFRPVIGDAVERTLLRELPTELFKNGACFPLHTDGHILQVAVADPLDLDTLLRIELATGLVVETTLTTPSEMERTRQHLFQGDTLLRHSAHRITEEYQQQMQRDESALSLDEIRKRTESEPVVKMVSLVFDEAITLRASDIHVEPTEHDAVVRFRIDGMLRQHMELSKWMYLPFTSRVKILANLDIAEKRVPQDGRIRYGHDGKQYDFRVSTLPTHWGEKTVIRILKHDITLLDMANLGLDTRQMEVLTSLITKPQGIVFVTGPTGSGKSSTLFACLNRIRGEAINITTIENPIEYKLDGINQVQIHEKAGVTFARTLRSILRQDPDVILIGEIRDHETAEIAIQASQTGHLVFSTLHTNDAISAITRLIDLRIPPFMISSALLAILGQRLVRVLCPHCRLRAQRSMELSRRWSAMLGELELPDYYEAPGCRQCGQSGFLGRTGIFELIVVDETLREMIADKASETAIRKAVRAQGGHTMLEDGVDKIRRGITSPAEVLRVTMADGVG
jgi:type II secretory ATPase GspE/PulE/Tfp pilus assembly ATPase PilB-like protein